jgi:outer membrane protein assembly factor BamB
LHVKNILQIKSKEMKTNKKTQKPTPQKPLRLWPGVVIVILQWLVRFVIPIFVSGDLVTQLGVFGGVIGGLAILVWWTFFSRVPWLERLGILVLMVVALVITNHFLDVSLQTAMMGLMFTIYSVPVMSLALVIGALVSRKLPNLHRRIVLIVTVLIASGFWTLLRTNGMTGDAHQDFAWRWAKTAEQRLLAQQGNKLTDLPSAQIVTNAVAEWPGFRGTNRDGIIYGVQIKTDWKASPPVELWCQPIGPGCSSFSVNGKLLYTQEQRGDNEVVSSYNLTTGQANWKHGDKARFYDSHAGAGPRSTPTLFGNRVYTLGATGIINVLNAGDGSVVWSRNAATDNGVKVLQWGFTGSPLVVNDVVIVSLSGKLAGYDAASGKPLWSTTDGGNSYSSPHLITIDGVSQVLLMSQAGALSVEPTSGKQLWKYEWPLIDRILQPAVISEGELLLAGEGNGISRIKVTHNQSEWYVNEVWKSDQMKLNFNDFIIHKGYAYGFDGANMACIDIKDGKRMWKGDRYRGWLLLLADQDLFLVLTEKGEIALVKATPDQFTELARIPAIKGKTWNHPVLVGNVMLVRNAQEMAAFRLPLTGD